MKRKKLKKSREYPRTSIVILNWNGLKDTLACLSSLREVKDKDFKTIVIDNGSKDKAEAIKIKKDYPEIHLIRASRNLGFSGGNNLGIRYAIRNYYDFILLLNNDTVVKKDFLSELLKKYHSEKNIGAVGPAIFYFGTKKIWPSVGRIYPWLANAKGAKSLKEIRHMERTRTITFLSGCTILIPSFLFKKIGLLNQDYFAYFEDAELCQKIQKAGYRLVAAPKSWIWHKVSVSTEGASSPIYTYYMTRNNLLFLKNQALWYTWPSALSFFLYWRVVKRVLRIFIKNEPQKLTQIKTIFRAIGDFLKGRFGKAKP